MALMLTVMATTAFGRSLVAKVGQWQVRYDTRSHTFTYNSSDGDLQIPSSVAEATYSRQGVVYRLSSADFRKAKVVSDGEVKRFVLEQCPEHQGMTMNMELRPFGNHLQLRMTLSICDCRIIRTLAA